jgi:proteasome activator subunit 4
LSIFQHFSDSSYVDKLVHFNTMEHNKGEDAFSMDKGLFFSFLFENFNDRFLPIFATHMKKLAESNDESNQVGTY